MAHHVVWGCYIAAVLVAQASGASLVGGVDRPYYGLQAPSPSECSATGPRINCGELRGEGCFVSYVCTAACRQ